MIFVELGLLFSKKQTNKQKKSDSFPSWMACEALNHLIGVAERGLTALHIYCVYQSEKT